MSNVQGTRVILDAAGKPRVQQVRIEVRRGPNKGAHFILEQDPIRVGTAEGCEVELTDSAVSGMHVEISRTNQGLLIRDLGSTNGTYIDGRRIQAVFATDTTTVQIGESELCVRPLDKNSPVEVAPEDRFGDMVGASMVMRSVYAKLKKLAATDATVLVTGETGTGKELVAGALHEQSPRARRPLVVVDCGALPANLIESELFGHERGAFTGADRTREGAFERAHGGTIFLDEIGELPLSLQPALLGVLQRREVRRVGGEKVLPINVRVVAATNRDLAAEVSRGAFRADLFYRLAVVEVKLPPLRERPEDIPLLIDHFLQEVVGERPTLGPEVMAQLKSYPWPGNVRELRNVIERATLLAEAPKPQPLRGQEPRAQASREVDIQRPFKEQKNALIADFELAYVRALLEHTGGNIAAAARKAKIDRMYLYKLIDRYALDVPKK